MKWSRVSTSIGISLKRTFGWETSLLRLVIKAWMVSILIIPVCIEKTNMSTYQMWSKMRRTLRPWKQGIWISLSWLCTSPAKERHPSSINGELWFSRLGAPALRLEERNKLVLFNSISCEDSDHPSPKQIWVRRDETIEAEQQPNKVPDEGFPVVKLWWFELRWYCDLTWTNRWT